MGRATRASAASLCRNVGSVPGSTGGRPVIGPSLGQVSSADQTSRHTKRSSLCATRPSAAVGGHVSLSAAAGMCISG